MGRDPESAVDAAYIDAGTKNFPNDGDNEPTGLYVSEGGIRVQDMQGKPMNPNRSRAFVTQQHGMNRVFEIVGE